MALALDLHFHLDLGLRAALARGEPAADLLEMLLLGEESTFQG